MKWVIKNDLTKSMYAAYNLHLYLSKTEYIEEIVRKSRIIF